MLALFLKWILVWLVMILFCLLHAVYFSTRIARSSHDSCFVVNLFTDELVHEKEKYKYICDDLDMTFTELIGN